MSRLPLFVLGFCLLLAGVVQAAPNYLMITTTDGKTLQAPVKSFKGLSLGVIATLVKEGKMTNPSENADPDGYMTFYLDKSVTSDFVVWAASSKAAATGRFQWVDPKGTATETFNMTGIKVTQFTGTGTGSTNGGTLVILADKTVANPPINFKKK